MKVLHPTCRTVLERMDEDRSRICSQSADLWAIEEVMEELDMEFRASLFSFSKEVDVFIEISSIKEVTPVLREFARRGYRQEQAMSQSADTRHAFTWFLCRPRGTVKGGIHIFGSIPVADESESYEGCRLVQVGTETYTTPKYEVVCEDGHFDPPQE